MRRLEGITDPMNMSLSKCQEVVKGKAGMLQSVGSQESDTTKRLKSCWMN